MPLRGADDWSLSVTCQQARRLRTLPKEVGNRPKKRRRTLENLSGSSQHGRCQNFEFCSRALMGLVHCFHLADESHDHWNEQPLHFNSFATSPSVQTSCLSFIWSLRVRLASPLRR